MRLFRFQMERARRFERPTLTLARLCSTPELRPRCHLVSRGLGNPARGCKRKICASRQKLLCFVRGGGCGMRSQKSERPHPKMRPFRFRMERARRFERPTLTLARLCSTPELRPRCHLVSRGLGNPARGCKRKICASRQKLLCFVRGGGCGMRSQKSERPHPKMRPFRFRMERARRFERPTLTLARLCSTPELRPRCHSVSGI